MGILSGKKALIVGVASDRSIAWSTAEFMHQQGAELAFTYLDDKLKKRVDKIACLLYTSPSPRDRTRSRMPSSA